MSKKDQCIELAIENPEMDRGELIQLFVEEVGMSPLTAGTYASDIRKALAASAPKRAALEARSSESDEEIAARLFERFDVIDDLSAASCAGMIRSLIISGPAGLGKSFAVEAAVRRYDPAGDKSIIAKGFVRPTGLYLLLHEYRFPGNVIVLDDADSIFTDPDALNLLKCACDTTKKREISWRAETKMQDADGEPIDRMFEFKGTIIFITNIDFDAEIARGGRSAEHFEALVSRSHYVDCDMHSTRDYLVRIKQVVALGMLRNQRGLTVLAEEIVMDFINDNADKLRELTLRMALKLADVYNMNPAKFESFARISCFKGGA